MIAIVDYGVGNLRSVEKALEYIGSQAIVTSSAEKISDADAVILPGVGAFADAMDSLRKADLLDVVRYIATHNKPFLGICLGMQLLFEYSEEGGERVPGLGVLPGSIRKLPGDMGLKIPHMGWNALQFDAACPLFQQMPSVPHVYFVHSYYLEPEDPAIVAATTHYGREIAVAVHRKNLFATQFHPEKSGVTGLQMLRNFVTII